jgi:hypothetical protein
MRRRVPPDSSRRRRVAQPLRTLPGCLPFVSSALPSLKREFYEAARLRVALLSRRSQ